MPGRRARRRLPCPPIPFRHRLYGLGSIYGKTVRDSRLAFIIVAGLLGGMALVMGVAVSSIFPTPAARLEVDKLIGSMPTSMVNLFGKPVQLGTLGGYMTFKYGAIFALGTALWSILALSSTLAGEARRGSLDFVAVSPFGKRRIALEKLAAHLTMLGLAMAILALATTVASSLFGDAALGDPIPPLSAIGFALWVGCIALFFGGLAFALGPLLGRAGAAGVAGLAMIVLWLANGLDNSPRSRSDHAHSGGRPTTSRSSVGSTGHPWRSWASSRSPSWPSVCCCSGGATWGSRSASPCRTCLRRSWASTAPSAARSVTSCPERSAGASVWASSGPCSRRSWIHHQPAGQRRGAAEELATLFPSFDLTSAGGFLQLYVQMLYIAAGFAGATFVAEVGFR